MTEIGFEMSQPDLTCKYKPTASDIEAAREWGAEYGRLVLKMGEASPEG
jgi:flavorubredoxin